MRVVPTVFVRGGPALRRDWRPGPRPFVIAGAAAIVLGMAFVIAEQVADELREGAMESALHNVEAIVRGYVDPVIDEMWTKALGTISDREREPLLVEALKAMTADAIVTVTHLQPRPMAYRAGLTGPRETWVGESALVWNIWEWQWK